MAVSILERKRHGVPDLTGLRLPGACFTRKLATEKLRRAHLHAILTEADGRDLGAGVQGEMSGRSHCAWGFVIRAILSLIRTGERCKY